MEWNIQGANDIDTTLFQIIENEDFSGWNLFDKDVFSLCFRTGINKVMMKLLASGYEEKYQTCFEKGESLLMKDFRASEEVVIKVLNRYFAQISGSLQEVIPNTNENLLHHLLKNGFQNAVLVLIEKYDIKDLYFSRNVANDIPLNIAIRLSRDNEDNTFNAIRSIKGYDHDQNIAALLWRGMLQTNQSSKINDVVSQINSKQQNLLHACAEGKLNFLISEICLSSEIDSAIVRTALDEPDSAGLMPLLICNDEKTVLEIMEVFPDLNIGHVDKKGNNLVHVYAKKNFVGCLKRIINSLNDRKRLAAVLSQKNLNGNSPPMSCVFKHSTDALNYLLCTLFTLDDEEKNMLLHEKNTKGDTLLGLLLYYQKEGSLSEIIALEMEKLCHNEANEKDETMKSLTNCLKSHVEPSNNVLCAIQDVEESFPKTNCEKITVWIQLFISSFLMPLAIMISDMSFDVLLVVGYAILLLQIGEKKSQSTLGNLCGNLSSSRNETETFPILRKLYTEIPGKLTTKPRFFYSLAFIVLPWLFYGIEFCHSRHLTNTIRQVIVAHRNH